LIPNPLWLRSLIAVAELGSFTRAAEQLDLTQAAVSQHLQRLEAQYGALLIRRPRKLDITPRGQTLLAYARELEAAHARLEARLADGEAERGEVAIATPGSIGLAIYPLLLQLQERHPGLVFRHRFAPTGEIVRAVIDNEIDWGLVAVRPDDPRLSISAFANEALCLVAPAQAAAETWDELMSLGLIDHPDGRDMATRLLARRFPGASIERLPRRGFINQIGLILDPVARGLGFAVLPGFAVEAYARPNAVRIVPGEPEVIDTLWLVHRAEWPLNRRAQSTLDWLQQALRPTVAPAQ
jgi:DNA-binding transcriptional LysR family regulator